MTIAIVINIIIETNGDGENDDDDDKTGLLGANVSWHTVFGRFTSATAFHPEDDLP